MEINQIITQNCLEFMANIETESVDCCITDCPYKIISGGARKEVLGDEPTAMMNHRDYSTTDPKGCLNRGKTIDNLEVQNNVKNGKMFANNDIGFAYWLPELYRILKNKTHTYIMVNARNLKDLQVEAEKAGFIFQNLLCWSKNTQTPNKYYMQSAEFILMLRKGNAKNINNMGTKTVLSIPNFTGKGEKGLHPTQKPILLLEILLLNSTKENDVVIDPFCGSGSLALTCQKHSRNFLSCDIDSEYTDMANKNLKLGWKKCQQNWGELINNQITLFTK
jgi:site-specific DNA-methyltransferase (adenine-specific)